MWSTTTRRRGTTSGRRCPSRASTIRPTTVWSTEQRERYYDTTGTGNSLNVGHPTALRLILDSLRYWVTDMHVDGFRFDLATTLTRQTGDTDAHSAFLDLVYQDPVLAPVKLIAEPWDVAGYMVGGFPARWSEWNGKYRDTVRDFWRGEEGSLGELALRLTGSGDIYSSDRRVPTASVNFVTAHDGFTVADLTAYNEKHNEANGEDNRDGESDNRSWNCGVEGPTDDAAVNELRARQRRNLIGTLLLSAGIPMLLGGDEIGAHPAGQQQRLLPGQRDLLVRLGAQGRGSARLHPHGGGPPARPPGAAAS